MSARAYSTDVQPTLSIRVIDDEDQQDLDGRVLSFSYADDEKKTAEAQFVVDNPDRRFHQSPIWRPGTLFEVAWSAGGLTSAASRMVVPKGAMTGPLNRFTIRLQEAGVVMAVEPRGSRRFDNRTHSEVVTEIASENGFSGEFVDVYATTQRYSSVTRRADETDAAFLVRLARLNRDFSFWIDALGLHWRPRDLMQQPIMRLGLGDMIGDVNIDEIKPDRPARVRVASRDRAGKRDVALVADNLLDAARPGLGSVLALGTSAQSVADSLGVDPALFLSAGKLLVGGTSVRERVDPETGRITSVLVPPESRIGGSEVQRSARPGDDQATGGYREAQIGAAAISVRVRGNPYLRARTVVEVDVGDERLSGRYWVRSSTHDLSDGSNGYTTRLKLISDGHGGHSTIGDTTFDFGRVGRSRTAPGQDFDLATQQLESLLTILLPFADRSSDFQAVKRDLARDLERTRARKPGSVARARKTVARLQKIAQRSGVPILVQSSSFAGARLDEAQRGETLSSAAQSTANVRDGELVERECVDPELGRVVRYREGDGGCD